jgi:thiosulfate/3-mercaptopyruvate sulfurtransferase
MTLAREWPDTIDRAGIVAAGAAIDLVDVRAPERYRGELEPVDAVPGHIPGARSLPAASMMDELGCMLPSSELPLLICGESDRAQRPLVFSCGSGVTACYGLLAARVAGLPDPILYPGSYSDWARSGMPVATGPEPGR